MNNIVRRMVGLFVAGAGLSLLMVAVRGLMNVGGFCAEGGPFEIAVHCPDGIEMYALGGVFLMLVGALLYVFSSMEVGRPNWSKFFWTIVFGAIGIQNLIGAFQSPEGEGIVWTWLIMGVSFIFVGLLLPFIYSFKYSFEQYFGKNSKEYKLALLHVVVGLVGAAAGYFLYITLSV